MPVLLAGSFGHIGKMLLLVLMYVIPVLRLVLLAVIRIPVLIGRLKDSARLQPVLRCQQQGVCALTHADGPCVGHYQ